MGRLNNLVYARRGAGYRLQAELQTVVLCNLPQFSYRCYQTYYRAMHCNLTIIEHALMRLGYLVIDAQQTQTQDYQGQNQSVVISEAIAAKHKGERDRQ